MKQKEKSKAHAYKAFFLTYGILLAYRMYIAYMTTGAWLPSSTVLIEFGLAFGLFVSIFWMLERNTP